MTAERCAFLIAKGLSELSLLMTSLHSVSAAMYHKIAEFVVSEQPILFILDFAEQFPYLMREIAVKVVGPNRVKALQAGGLMYDMQVSYQLVISCYTFFCLNQLI